MFVHTGRIFVGYPLSSVLATDAYSNIIILGTEEYKKIVEHIPFS
jgi:hypothetical protein